MRVQWQEVQTARGSTSGNVDQTVAHAVDVALARRQQLPTAAEKLLERRTSDRRSRTLDVSRALALPALTSHSRSPVRMC